MHCVIVSGVVVEILHVLFCMCVCGVHVELLTIAAISYCSQTENCAKKLCQSALVCVTCESLYLVVEYFEPAFSDVCKKETL